MIPDSIALLGLITELGGFGILAWDLLPKYRLDNEIARLRQAMEAAECIYVTGCENDGQSFYVNDQKALTKIVLSIWQKYRWQVPAHVERDPGAIKILSQTDVDDMSPFISRIITQRVLVRENLEGRPRPPLGFGVALVVVGATLQIISVACTIWNSAS